jgi:hypothetical protein
MKNRKDVSKEERRVQKEWNKAGKRKKRTDGDRMQGIRKRMEKGRKKRRTERLKYGGRVERKRNRDDKRKMGRRQKDPEGRKITERMEVERTKIGG